MLQEVHIQGRGSREGEGKQDGNEEGHESREKRAIHRKPPSLILSTSATASRTATSACVSASESVGLLSAAVSRCSNSSSSWPVHARKTPRVGVHSSVVKRNR